MTSTIASTLQLPPGSWTNVLECLCGHFSAVSREQWLDRFARGRVLDQNGSAITPEHPYRTGMTVRYFREVAAETRIPFEARIVHSDADLVIADKPHFLAVTPAGRFVEETLLRRLIRETGNSDLVPLHRIDRATAGLVMFSASPATRGSYQTLFRTHIVRKHYEAIAPALPNLDFPVERKTRIVAGQPFFRMREIDGPANSETRIDVLQRDAQLWRYALTPITGRTHQLRVHMAGLGAGILNDRFYPFLADQAAEDFTRPLKLLARSLEFTDPFSGELRRFESRLSL